MSSYFPIAPLLNIAKEAGDLILQYYYEDTEIRYKADMSPLTQADEASHTHIVTFLEKFTPHIPVLSEESTEILSYTERQKWPLFWLLDPLDGTKEFIHKRDEFTVNIALIQNGVPILGIVHAPVLDICYYSTWENKAFQYKDGVHSPLTPLARQNKEKLIIVGSRSHSDEKFDALLNEIRIKTPQEIEVVFIGSSLKLCMVASGEADIYPRTGPTMEWDTAAADAVVRASGGRVCALDQPSHDLNYNKENLKNPAFIAIRQNLQWPII
jgi:3'(2'), 5'-bisphosphate nucleotidase